MSQKPGLRSSRKIGNLEKTKVADSATRTTKSGTNKQDLLDRVKRLKTTVTATESDASKTSTNLKLSKDNKSSLFRLKSTKKDKSQVGDYSSCEETSNLSRLSKSSLSSSTPILSQRVNQPAQRKIETDLYKASCIQVAYIYSMLSRDVAHKHDQFQKTIYNKWINYMEVKSKYDAVVSDLSEIKLNKTIMDGLMKMDNCLKLIKDSTQLCQQKFSKLSRFIDLADGVIVSGTGKYIFSSAESIKNKVSTINDLLDRVLTRFANIEKLYHISDVDKLIDEFNKLTVEQSKTIANVNKQFKSIDQDLMLKSIVATFEQALE